MSSGCDEVARDYTRRYYPVFLDLEGRTVVVIGGGAVAARKVTSLVEHGARVRVVAPRFDERIASLSADGGVELVHRGYVRGDLAGAALAVCATDSAEVNRAVHDEAAERGCMVNVVDVPELCDFIVPSVVRRGQLQLAISTGGAAPSVAKAVRRELEARFGDEWAPYLELLGQVRVLVMERVPGGEAARKPIFDAIAASDLLERVRAGERPNAEDVFVRFAGGERS